MSWRRDVAAGLEPFPEDWRTALVLVPHPDDPEYGIGAAVAAWTSAGRTVRYALATRGEQGIEGMPADQAGPLREGEQRRSAAIVGVDDVTFWDFADTEVRDTPRLRARIAAAIEEVEPDVVVTIYSGPEWGPGMPNQRDHIEFANAVAAAYDSLDSPPRWLFENGPGATHGQPVDGFVDTAVASLAAHEVYLRVLDPDTPVVEQARRQVEEATPSFDGRPTVEFIQRRP
ncbi:PIG-L family deacetylase [Mycobacterium sp. 236(2023)]|uniref:PIG-L deacetylase family protein n=1 Tax=Mycobacterium sp. 236(2023) TaxID=3038163 RepID=UPI0024158D71|nr:PIG-L family deacetylase [Mycobacterium sp. 236(2023)]MDG4664465.1 PIG-L family deacetylase [Mycobacterium sp. 236(2023)]